MKHSIIFIGIVLSFILGLGSIAFAQDTTEESGESTVPAAIINSTEPRRINAGNGVTLSIIGSNFTNQMVVRLVDFGLLQTTFINSGAMTAEVPATIRGRNTPYVIELVNGDGTSMDFGGAFTLRVVVPQVPTTEPEPIPSPTPQTINTAPQLMVTGFVSNPSTIDAGQSFNVSFTVTNRGNDTARAISIGLGSNSSFVPAAGQATVTLPDLYAGASATGQMNIAASLEIASGPVMIPLALSYQDFEGESYTGTAELSVTVRETADNAQLIIDAYTVDPSPAEAGQSITLRMTIFNVGDSTASQVLLRVGGDGGILFPNGRGDSIPVADIASRERVAVELPMLVSPDAENGPQVQPVTISYMQDGETQEMSSNITIPIAPNNRPAPLLLLAAYDTGLSSLQPGNRFTLTVDIQNAGRADAVNTVIAFGTVQSTDGNGSGSGSGSGGSGGSSTTPSSTFAPLGSAGLSFVGDISTGEVIQVSQEFIVSGSVSSGVYPLPISLQYIMPDGSSKQDSLNISLVVIVPPRLQFNPPQPLPEMLNTNEPMPITLEIKNNGRDVNFVESVVTMENGEVLDGANMPMEVLKAGDDTVVSAMVMPTQDGEVQVTIILHYLDELNQAQTIELSYLAQASTPPPIEEPPYEPPVVVEPEPEVNWFGRFMMALLGLGS